MKKISGFIQFIGENRNDLFYKIQIGINTKSDVATIMMKRSATDRVKYGHSEIKEFYVTEKIAKEAYRKYAIQEGKDVQSYEQIIRRGGFSMAELDFFVPNWKRELVDAEMKEAPKSTSTKFSLNVKIGYPLSNNTMSEIFVKIKTEAKDLIEAKEKIKKYVLNKIKTEIFSTTKDADIHIYRKDGKATSVENKYRVEFMLVYPTANGNKTTTKISMNIPAKNETDAEEKLLKYVPTKIKVFIAK